MLVHAQSPHWTGAENNFPCHLDQAKPPRQESACGARALKSTPETMTVTFDFSPMYDFFDYSVLQKHTEKEFTMN
jgi:hypothetical protein